MKNTKKKLTDKEQQVASEILTAFMFTNNMEDVMKVWQDIYNAYELCDDPFTHTPCSPKEYAENSLEYSRQTMIAKYGHCDGLE